MSDDVNAFISVMKKRARVETDGQLAKLLGVSSSAVSKWRRRGRVSDRAVSAFFKAVTTPIVVRVFVPPPPSRHHADQQVLP
jgi:DNA-binding transcriptional regulator YdaS (Cro superfamily)